MGHPGIIGPVTFTFILYVYALAFSTSSRISARVGLVVLFGRNGRPRRVLIYCLQKAAKSLVVCLGSCFIAALLN
jgi:hypothetical protein